MSHAHSRNLAIRLGIGALVALLVAMPAATVAADATSGGTPVPSATSATNSPNSPQQVGLNTPVTFTGNGFKPNESLSVWEIGPDGSIVPLAGIQTDGTGAFTTTITFRSAGQWQVTAHSIANGNESVGIYSVGSGTSTTAPITPPAPSPSTSAAPGFVPPANPPAAPQVAVGAPVLFSGTGFTANEAVSLWETPPGGGTPTALPGVTADETGAFSASVTFPSNGQWQVTAHGVTSGHETIGRYAVGDVSAAPAAPAAGATGATQVALGATVTFSGTGFTANEAVSLWETAPGGNVVALPGVTADANGAVATTVAFSLAGQWEVTAHGITSTHEVIATYIAGTGGTTPGTTPAGPSGTLGVNAPQVAVGSPVTVSGTGFRAGETVSFWETGPDTTVTPLGTLVADANGAVSESVTFATGGYWQVTAHGQASAHEVISGYNVTGGPTTAPAASPATSPAVRAPVSTTVNAVVNFAAPSFNANEVINAWTTAPDGTVTRLDTTAATGNGIASVSTSFNTTGLWKITLHGKDSGHEVTGQYQVS